ncbi:MAG: guanylate kinase [Clostridiales bacterium]|nr:guanylate kinase [Clostridiales bacterium]
MSEIRKGMLLVISGPSGTGKGTLIEKLMKEDPTLVFSVSATTRAPRPGEIDGVHYHFVSNEKYDALVAEGAFVEYATVHGNRYGTLRSEVYQRLERGENVVLDIDVQGALNVIASEKEKVSIFLLPPSLKELRRRLTERGTETPEQVETRLGNAIWEISQKDKYEYKVINDDMEECLNTLRAIIKAEKHASAYYAVEVPQE